MRYIKRIIIHCTASTAGSGLKGERLKRMLMNVFRNERGWKNPGYHIVIDEDGLPMKLLDFDKVSNGAYGYNKTAINIAYHGGAEYRVTADGRRTLVGKDTRTDAQKATLRQVVTELKKQFPKAVVMGHRDLSPDRDHNGRITPDEWIKYCPSFDVATEL